MKKKQLKFSGETPLMVLNRLLIGRHEWCQFPDLGIPAIKAKIDTGAKTSAIHAFDIQKIKKNNRAYVKFNLHPLQQNEDTIVNCIAPLVDSRYIMSSNGLKEYRYIILTTLMIGNQKWEVELSLSNREPLRHRLLLGREALNHRVLIDPSLTCHQQKISRKTALKIYSSSTEHSKKS